MFGKKKAPSQNAAPEQTGSKKERKKLTQRVEEWNVEDKVVDDVLNVIVSIIILCVLASIGLFTLTFEDHIISIFVLPLLIYLAFNMPGIKLRMRERLSVLIIPDILCVIMIIVSCLCIDSYYADRDGNVYLVVIVAFLGIFTSMSFLSRSRQIFRLAVPFSMIYGAAVAYMAGLNPMFLLAISLGMGVAFYYFTLGHGFYFGIGRMFIDGKYCKVPDEEVRKYEAEKKAAAKAEAQRKKAEAAEKKVANKNTKL